MGERETVAALAGQLAGIRDEVTELRSSMAAFRARLDTETGPVMVLQAEVKKLRERAEKLDAGPGPAGATAATAPAATAPRWDGLDPAAEARQLGRLRAWVEGVLRAQFPGYAVPPPCWPDHREARWELGTLMAEWDRVFSGNDDGEDDDGPALADVQWLLERWMPGALTRLQRSIPCDGAGCIHQARARPRAAPATGDPLSFPRTRPA